MKTKFQQLLLRVGGCSQGIAWVGQKPLVQAWNECDNAEWLIWFAQRSNTMSHKRQRLLACALAHTVVHLTHHASLTPALRALLTAEAFAVDAATAEDLRTAEAEAWGALQHVDSRVGCETAAEWALNAKLRNENAKLRNENAKLVEYLRLMEQAGVIRLACSVLKIALGTPERGDR